MRCVGDRNNVSMHLKIGLDQWNIGLPWRVSLKRELENDRDSNGQTQVGNPFLCKFVNYANVLISPLDSWDSVFACIPGKFVI